MLLSQISILAKYNNILGIVISLVEFFRPTISNKTSNNNTNINIKGIILFLFNLKTQNVILFILL